MANFYRNFPISRMPLIHTRQEFKRYKTLPSWLSGERNICQTKITYEKYIQVAATPRVQIGKPSEHDSPWLHLQQKLCPESWVNGLHGRPESASGTARTGGISANTTCSHDTALRSGWGRTYRPATHLTSWQQPLPFTRVHLAGHQSSASSLVGLVTPRDPTSA